MRLDLVFLTLTTFGCIIAAPAVAADKVPQQPQAFKELVECKTIADPTERLSCYDLQVNNLMQGAASGDLVVTDRASVHEAKKGLFGFRIPTLGIFGGGGDDTNEVKSVEGTVTSARQFGYGTWRIALEDGSVWEQIDNAIPVFNPRTGSKVKVYRGALGTFRMNIDEQRAIKVRRIE